MPHGICVYKSTDGGQTFSILKCVENGGDEHDGSTLAVGDDGSVYFATADMTLGRTVVWRIDPNSGAATLLPSPFTDSSTRHPRLRAEHGTGRVYVMTTNASGTGIIANYWDGSSWGTEQRLVNDYNDDSISFRVGGAIIREAPNFSFDLNPQATWNQCFSQKVCMVNGHVFYPPITNPNYCPGVWTTQYKCYTYSDDAYSFVFAYTAATTSATGQRIVVKTYACRRSLMDCREITVWEPPATTGDQWEPLVRGRMLSYLSRENDPAGNSYSVVVGDIMVTGSSSQVANRIATTVETSTNVCPHPEPTGGVGYIGDYNDLEVFPGPQAGTSSFHIRTFTASPNTCDTTNGDDQSVEAAVWQ
jgi:hypothetical protein